jgi:UDP-N-acetylglucosamine transferase subunit ALG13
VGTATEKVWKKGAVLGEGDLIFVTVGGMRAFDRLIREVDRIAAKVDEEVVMQIGSTDYEPKNCDYFRFLPVNEIEELYADARVVVCHAGIGSILTAVKYNKPLILVPRLQRYGEVFDDHQLEIAREMESRGMTVVYDISNLESAVDNENIKPIEFEGETNLVHKLKEYLDQMKK